MEISNLENTKIETVVNCLNQAFANYFVPMPSDVTFWEKRFAAARVDYGLSPAVFDKEKLFAFIIHAVDIDQGEKTAFNTGTGVLPDYRRQKWVDKMYDYILPHLKEQGVTKCKLEVIDKNARAIAVYERIGFRKTHRLKCYKGTLIQSENESVTIKECPLQEIADFPQRFNKYSWDNTEKTIKKSMQLYKVFQVFDADNSAGYFIINPKNGYIAQLYAAQDQWDALFAGIQKVCADIKINNIQASRTGLIQYLDIMNIKNTIDQYEMEMSI